MKIKLKLIFNILRKVGFLLYVALVVTLVYRAYFLRARVTLELMIPAEELNLPVFVNHFPNDLNRMVVVEKAGIIKWFYANSTQAEGTVLDLEKTVYSAGWEEGLFTIIFDPNFKENRYYYVFYSLGKPLRSRISRFTLNPDYSTDLDSELKILEIKKVAEGHNGGSMEFGPDNYLYASIGFGSFRMSEWDFLQNRTTLYGSIIRIDVSNSTPDQPYTIPPDNPFVGSKDGSRGEIWAYGLRNAWRFSFDRKSGKIYTGDVGEVTREEVNLIKKGGNYGWPFMEGELCFPPKEKQDCDKTGMELPMLSMGRLYSRSVTGGYVYHGEKIPWLKGKYIFGDYLRGILYIDIDHPEEMLTTPEILLYKPPTLHGPNKGRTVLFSSFGEDENGELYAVNIEGGVYRLNDIHFGQQLKGFLYQVANFR
jgi:glucose/arabinose dehydrogenase